MISLNKTLWTFHKKQGLALLLMLASLHGRSAEADQVQTLADATQLKRLTLEELMNVEITTAARKAEPLFTTPAAVQVITQEDIRRAGASSIPEALRLAPNLQVAQVDSRQWAISSRGFNNG